MIRYRHEQDREQQDRDPDDVLEVARDVGVLVLARRSSRRTGAADLAGRGALRGPLAGGLGRALLGEQLLPRAPRRGRARPRSGRLGLGVAAPAVAVPATRDGGRSAGAGRVGRCLERASPCGDRDLAVGVGPRVRGAVGGRGYTGARPGRGTVSGEGWLLDSAAPARRIVVGRSERARHPGHRRRRHRARGRLRRAPGRSSSCCSGGRRALDRRIAALTRGESTARASRRSSRPTSTRCTRSPARSTSWRARSAVARARRSGGRSSGSASCASTRSRTPAATRASRSRCSTSRATASSSAASTPAPARASTGRRSPAGTSEAALSDEEARPCGSPSPRGSGRAKAG